MWAQQSTAQWRSASRLVPWRITVPYLREDLLQLTVVQLPGVPVQKLLQFSLGNSSIVVGINTVVCTTMQKRDEVKAHIKSIEILSPAKRRLYLLHCGFLVVAAEDKSGAEPSRVRECSHRCIERAGEGPLQTLHGAVRA